MKTILVLSSHTPSLFWFRMDMMKAFLAKGNKVIAVGSDPDVKWAREFGKNNIEYSVADRLNMSDLSRMMSRHYMVVAWHALEESPEAMAVCEEEAAGLKEDIIGKLDEMNERIAGDE